MKMKDKRNVIYGIYDPRKGSICYVGKTMMRLGLRWRAHRNELKRKTHCNHRLQYLHDKLKRCGLGKLYCKMLEECTAFELSDAEVRWIAKLRAEGVDLFNATDGGEGAPGHFVSEATREKISKAKRGRPNIFSPSGMKSFIEKQKARIPTVRQLEALVVGRTDPEIVARNRKNVRKAGRKRRGMKLPVEWKKAMSLAAKKLWTERKIDGLGNSVLTIDEVLEIRKRHIPGHGRNSCGARKMSRDYGVSFVTIQNVLSGKTWKNPLSKERRMSHL